MMHWCGCKWFLIFRMIWHPSEKLEVISEHCSMQVLVSLSVFLSTSASPICTLPKKFYFFWRVSSEICDHLRCSSFTLILLIFSVSSWCPFFCIQTARTNKQKEMVVDSQRESCPLYYNDLWNPYLSLKAPLAAWLTFSLELHPAKSLSWYGTITFITTFPLFLKFLRRNVAFSPLKSWLSEECMPIYGTP